MHRFPVLDSGLPQRPMSSIVLMVSQNDAVEICSLLRSLVEDAYRNADPQSMVRVIMLDICGCAHFP